MGVGFVTAAFFCSALMSTLAKVANDVGPITILFLQYAISFAFYLPAAIRTGPEVLRTKSLALQILRSLFGSVCQLLFFIAVRHTPLMDSVLLSNSAPLFIPFIVWIWFGKRVQPVVWASLVLGLLGIVLIIKPGPEMFQNPASLVALLAGLFSAFALVATNKLAETEPPVRILVYNFGTSTILLSPVFLWQRKPLLPKQWLLLIGVGLLYALTQYLIIIAYRYADSAQLSPFNYTVVIFSGLLGWIFFGLVPTIMAVAGTVLICLAGILSVRRGHPEGRGHAVGSGHWIPHWRSKPKALAA
jgi:drug/metabolite transporter (DMT)-like permease